MFWFLRDFWSVLFCFSVWITCVTSTNLRGTESVEGRTIECRVTVAHTLFLTEEGQESSTEDTICIELEPGHESLERFSYNIHLPERIQRYHNYEIQKGLLYVSITNAIVAHDSILTTKHSQFTVRRHKSSQRHLEAKSYNQTIGQRTLAVVTVSTTGGQRVSYSHGKLRNQLFRQEQSMFHQYQCQKY